MKINKKFLKLFALGLATIGMASSIFINEQAWAAEKVNTNEAKFIVGGHTFDLIDNLTEQSLMETDVTITLCDVETLKPVYGLEFYHHGTVKNWTFVGMTGSSSEEKLKADKGIYRIQGMVKYKGDIATSFSNVLKGDVLVDLSSNSEIIIKPTLDDKSRQPNDNVANLSVTVGSESETTISAPPVVEPEVKEDSNVQNVPGFVPTADDCFSNTYSISTGYSSSSFVFNLTDYAFGGLYGRAFQLIEEYIYNNYLASNNYVDFGFEKNGVDKVVIGFSYPDASKQYMFIRENTYKINATTHSLEKTDEYRTFRDLTASEKLLISRI